METLEQCRARMRARRIRRSPLGRTFGERFVTPATEVIDPEDMETVARRDLGTSRTLTYRDLGRGPTGKRAGGSDV